MFRFSTIRCLFIRLRGPQSASKGWPGLERSQKDLKRAGCALESLTKSKQALQSLEMAPNMLAGPSIMLWIMKKISGT